VSAIENNTRPTARTLAHEWNSLDERRIRWIDALPILTIHALCLGVIWTGWSWTAVGAAVVLYLVRMFVITAFYHRYFSHRTFQTHRWVRLLAACIGVSAAQRGPLWWAAHHREHHRHSDEEPDLHSPWWKGVLWSHTGWFLTQRGRATNWKAVPDWSRSRELLWVERNHILGPVVLVAALAGVGWALAVFAPGLGTGPAQLVVWGFGVSTTALYHATFTINSLAHTVGSRRFQTGDDSRNNWFLALLTLHVLQCPRRRGRLRVRRPLDRRRGGSGGQSAAAPVVACGTRRGAPGRDGSRGVAGTARGRHDRRPVLVGPILPRVSGRLPRPDGRRDLVGAAERTGAVSGPVPAAFLRQSRDAQLA
jgi:stearoyl-CoA desaturase (delta-9 desaturase)